MGIPCGTAHLSESEKNRSGLVKRTMNREGDGERSERAGSGGTTSGSDSWTPGVKQLERHKLPFQPVLTPKSLIAYSWSVLLYI